MDKLIEDIDRVVNLINVLKSRYFFLRSKYNIGKVLIFLYRQLMLWLTNL